MKAGIRKRMTVIRQAAVLSTALFLCPGALRYQAAEPEQMSEPALAQEYSQSCAEMTAEPEQLSEPALEEKVSQSFSGMITETEQPVIPALSQDLGRDEGGDSQKTQTELPSRYNLAEEGKKPTVRSQGNTGTCWAIAACSAIESDLLPDTELVLSPDHMSLQNGFSAEQKDGGDYYMIMSYLSDWKGPVTEEEDPYGDGESPDGLSPAVHVQEIRLLRDMTRAGIKQMILRYGAAQSSLCLDRKRTDTDEYHYYNEETCAYFDPLTENLNHDILILGWDDSFSRENFRIKPPLDGAWICQNTWGEDFGENGIFYVSYEDRNLFRKGGVVYNRIEKTDNYDHVYENDFLGWQGRQGYDSESCWFAGEYSASSDELLSAVGIYSTGSGTSCSIYLLENFTDAEDLKLLTDPDAADSRLIARGEMDSAGFFTIDLDNEIPLSEGERFAIAVYITSAGAKKPVVVELQKDSYTQNVTLAGRHTWISKDAGTWDSTQEKYSTNVCLKVYTRDAVQKETES